MTTPHDPYSTPPGFTDPYADLINISGAAVSLEGWHFEAIRYTFGPEAVIEPGGLVVVVPLEPADFRATHNVPDAAGLFGPHLGPLGTGAQGLRGCNPGGAARGAATGGGGRGGGRCGLRGGAERGDWGVPSGVIGVEGPGDGSRVVPCWLENGARDTAPDSSAGVGTRCGVC